MMTSIVEHLDPGALIPIALVTIGVGLGFVAAASLLTRRGATQPGALRAIGGPLGITHRQRRLLHAMARSAGITTPACLLISRGSFDHAMRRYVAAHGQGERVAAIRTRVFEDEPMTPG